MQRLQVRVKHVAVADQVWPHWETNWDMYREILQGCEALLVWPYRPYENYMCLVSFDMEEYFLDEGCEGKSVQESATAAPPAPMAVGKHTRENPDCAPGMSKTGDISCCSWSQTGSPGENFTSGK